MKKKSILWSLFTLVMVAMMSAGFTACSDNDDDTGSGSGVVGTWSGQSGGKRYLTLSFKSGGSGTYTSRYNDSYSGTETDRGNFTYEMEGESKGVITVREYDSYSGYYTDYIYFEIEGKKMYLYDEYWGGYLEMVLTKE